MVAAGTVKPHSEAKGKAKQQTSRQATSHLLPLLQTSSNETMKLLFQGLVFQQLTHRSRSHPTVQDVVTALRFPSQRSTDGLFLKETTDHKELFFLKKKSLPALLGDHRAPGNALYGKGGSLTESDKIFMLHLKASLRTSASICLCAAAYRYPSKAHTRPFHFTAFQIHCTVFSSFNPFLYQVQQKKSRS